MDGKMILEKRRTKGLTQDELGSLLGISGKAVSKWGRGLSQLCEEHLTQLVELLSLPKEYLPQPVEQQRGKSTVRRCAGDCLRILCTACMLAFSAGALTGLLPVESALPLVGASGGVFALITLCRSKP
jgi:transcriptional regulator with XRE-family HTH domain